MKFFIMLLGLTVALFPLLSRAQTNRIFLAGGRGNEQFNTVFQLSDSTVLIGGESENLNWLPVGAPINLVTLDTITGQSPISSSPNSLGFILHVSKDLGQILNVIRLPANTLESINKIKTTSKPGDPTGEIYFSGRRGGAKQGYFVGRLDKNFISEIPTKIEMGININSTVVSTGGKHSYDGASYHRIFQPWDVDADGHVLGGTGEEFEFDWATIDKFNRNGQPDSVEFFPRQLVRLDGGIQWPAITGKVAEIAYRTASNLPDSLWVKVIDNPSPNPDVFDSVKVVGTAGANIMLKSYRVGGLRSTNQSRFDVLVSDENGIPGRKHTLTDDFLFNSFCGPASCSGDGPGYLGYSVPNIWTGRVGDVAIDRRNGDMYFTYTIPTSGPTQQTAPQGKASSYDMQPVLVAMQKNGQVKWWARLMKEAFDGNSADQITDGLAIDYAFNTIVILGHVFDTCTNNYWKGNEIALNPGGNGFQNSWTGSDPKIEYSWLGKYDLNSGRIKYATYVAENAKTTQTGSALTSPVYDNWSDPNSGNPRLTETITNIGGRTLEVDAQGKVYLLSTTNGRPITTGNAYQKMLKPDAGSTATDSLPPGEVSFVRIYTPTLNGLVYSSVVAGIWNPEDSITRSPVSLTGVLPTGNGFYLVGSHAGKNLPGESIPLATINPPTWANDSMKLKSGLVGIHKFGSIGFISRPVSISGPASHCPGETKTYSVVSPDPGATLGFQWVVPGANWSIVGPSNGSSVQIKFTGNLGGQLRVVAKNNNGTSEPAYLNIPNTTNPPTVSTSGFVCATGGTVTLTALGSTPGNFRWYPDSTTNFPIANSFDGTFLVTGINSTTRFFVTIVGQNGCETDRKGVNARFGKAAPAIVLLPANGPPYNALQSFPSSVPAGVTRSWTKNGIQVSTGAVIGLTGNATYTLCFTNSCGDSCVTYVVTGLSSVLKGLDIHIAPNPTSGNLNLFVEGENKETIQMSISDLLGRRISTRPLYRNYHSEEFVLETTQLRAGVYFITLQTKSGRKTIRFVKQ